MTTRQRTAQRSAACRWSAGSEPPTTAPASTTTRGSAVNRAAPGEVSRGGRVFARGWDGGDGFTLVEVIVVVALLAVLLLAAIPELLVPSEVDVELAARQVASDLGLARRLAIACRVDVAVTFNPPGGPYVDYTLAALGPCSEQGLPSTKPLPGQVTTTGTGQVTFRPSGAAAAAALLTFTSGGETAQVDVVRTTGRTRVTGP